MTVDQLTEATGLIALYKRGVMLRVSQSRLFDIERSLLLLGVRVDNPVGPPNPHAPEGGSAIAMRKVA